MNPSVEYTLNIFDRVIAAEGLDEEGEALLEGLDFRNLTIDEAAAALVEELEAEGGGGAFEVHHHGLEAQGQQHGHDGQGREDPPPGLDEARQVALHHGGEGLDRAGRGQGSRHGGLRRGPW